MSLSPRYATVRDCPGCARLHVHLKVQMDGFAVCPRTFKRFQVRPADVKQRPAGPRPHRPRYDFGG